MVKEQIKKLEEPAVQKLKEVSGMPYHDASLIKSQIRIWEVRSIILMSILVFNFFFFLEIVKSELHKVAEKSLVGFPNLINTAKVGC